MNLCKVLLIISVVNNILHKEEKSFKSSASKMNNFEITDTLYKYDFFEEEILNHIINDYYYDIPEGKKEYPSCPKLKNIDQSQQEGVYSSMKKLYDEYIYPGVTTILECNQAISQVLFPVALVAADTLIKYYQWSKATQVQIKPNSKLDKFLSKHGEAATSEVFDHGLDFMIGKYSYMARGSNANAELPPKLVENFGELAAAAVANHVLDGDHLDY